jgi:hypothetical protein
MKTNLTKWKELWEAGYDEKRCIKLSSIIENGAKADRLLAKMFVHNKRNKSLVVCVTYPYEITLDRIPDPMALLRWVEHLTSKRWMPSDLLGEFIKAVCKIKGWNLYGKQ